MASRGGFLFLALRTAILPFARLGLLLLTYEELVQRGKVHLDIFWLKDESLEDSAKSPRPRSARA